MIKGTMRAKELRDSAGTRGAGASQRESELMDSIRKEIRWCKEDPRCLMGVSHSQILSAEVGNYEASLSMTYHGLGGHVEGSIKSMKETDRVEHGSLWVVFKDCCIPGGRPGRLKAHRRMRRKMENFLVQLIAEDRGL